MEVPLPLAAQVAVKSQRRQKARQHGGAHNLRPECGRYQHGANGGGRCEAHLRVLVLQAARDGVDAGGQQGTCRRFNSADFAACDLTNNAGTFRCGRNYSCISGSCSSQSAGQPVQGRVCRVEGGLTHVVAGRGSGGGKDALHSRLHARHVRRGQQQRVLLVAATS